MAGFGPMFKTNITNASDNIVSVMVLKSGGMVADFGLLFRTNITNASNCILIVLWSDKGVAWWQVLGFCKFKRHRYR